MTELDLPALKKLCFSTSEVAGLDFDRIDRLAEAFEANGKISEAKSRTLDILALAHLGGIARTAVPQLIERIENQSNLLVAQCQEISCFGKENTTLKAGCLSRNGEVLW